MDYNYREKITETLQSLLNTQKNIDDINSNPLLEEKVNLNPFNLHIIDDEIEELTSSQFRKYYDKKQNSTEISRAYYILTGKEYESRLFLYFQNALIVLSVCVLILAIIGVLYAVYKYVWTIVGIVALIVIIISLINQKPRESSSESISIMDGIKNFNTIITFIQKLIVLLGWLGFLGGVIYALFFQDFVLELIEKLLYTIIEFRSS